MSNQTEIIDVRKYVQKDGNVVSDMDGEKVMLSVHNGKYYNLGEVGGLIWELLNEPKSVNDLVDKLIEEYDVSPAECESQVRSFLDMLKKENLID